MSPFPGLGSGNDRCREDGRVNQQSVASWPRAHSHLTRCWLQGLALGCLVCTPRDGALDLSFPPLRCLTKPRASSCPARAPSSSFSAHRPLSPRPLHPSAATPLCPQSRNRLAHIFYFTSAQTQAGPFQELAQLWARDRPPGCCAPLRAGSPSVTVQLAALGRLGSWSPRSARKAATAASAFPHVGIFSSAVH